MPENNPCVIARLLYNNETCYCTLPEFDLHRGDFIVIETVNGPEIAHVSGLSTHTPEGAELRKVLRQCTEEDVKKKRENGKRAQEAFDITLEKISKHGLEMKLVNIHYFLDDQKIIFNFTADGRVDFRELVKDLASVFKKRIELRQIGARDEAKIITGCGVCGRSFCCTYEHEAYCEFKSNYIEEGSSFVFEGKKVTLCDINILKGTATLRTTDNITFTVSLDRLPKAQPRQESRDEPVKEGVVVEEMQQINSPEETAAHT